jgi:hypothetical protein
VDQQAEATERALAFESRDKVIRQLDPFERLSQDELAGMYG